MQEILYALKKPSILACYSDVLQINIRIIINPYVIASYNNLALEQIWIFQLFLRIVYSTSHEQKEIEL